MSTDNLSYASGKKVPDNNPAIITPNCQECASSVESTCDGYADTIQRSIKILNMGNRNQMLIFVSLYFNVLSRCCSSNVTMNCSMLKRLHQKYFYAHFKTLFL